MILHSRWLKLILLLAAAGMIFYFSSQPAAESAEVSGFITGKVAEVLEKVVDIVSPGNNGGILLADFEHYIRKLGHVLEFFILGLMAANYFEDLCRRGRGKAEAHFKAEADSKAADAGNEEKCGMEFCMERSAETEAERDARPDAELAARLDVEQDRRSDVRQKNFVWYAIGFCVLYAVSDEVHQVFVPGRGPGLGDVLLDSVAATAAVLIFLGLNLRYRKRKLVG